MWFFIDTIAVCGLIALSIGAYEFVLWFRARARDRVENAMSELARADPPAEGEGAEPLRSRR